MSDAYVHFVVVNPGTSAAVERRIVDTPKGFEDWRREREAQGNRVKLVRRVRVQV